MSQANYPDPHEKRVYLTVAHPALKQVFNWLYGRKIRLSPYHYFSTNIFACRYQIAGFVSAIEPILQQQWSPKSAQIQSIYASTGEGSPIRECAVVQFLNKATTQRISILTVAPEQFVRDYQAFMFGRYQRRVEVNTTPPKQPLGRARAGWRSQVIIEMPRPKSRKLLHKLLLQKTKHDKPGFPIQVFGNQNLSEDAFETFASWLYFKLDL